MTFLSSGLMLLAIMGALLFLDAKVALIAGAAFGGSYAAITALSSRRLERNSRRVADGYAELIKALQEGLGGIRDVLLEGTQEFYCDVYRRADKQFRTAQGENTVISLGPRYLMELVVIILVAGLAYTLSRRAGGVVARCRCSVRWRSAHNGCCPRCSRCTPPGRRSRAAMHRSRTRWSCWSSRCRRRMLSRHPTPLAVRARDRRWRTCVSATPRTGPWVHDDLELCPSPRARGSAWSARTGCGKSTALDLLMGLLGRPRP